MKTRITELLGIEQPIIQGGMAWIADAKLAAAVSEAGGWESLPADLLPFFCTDIAIVKVTGNGGPGDICQLCNFIYVHFKKSVLNLCSIFLCEIDLSSNIPSENLQAEYSALSQHLPVYAQHIFSHDLIHAVWR